MSFPSHTWARLRNLTAAELIAALERDGWECDTHGGSMRIYRHPVTRRRVSIHFHPKKTFGPKMLKGLLEDIGWSEADMKRVKLL